MMLSAAHANVADEVEQWTTSRFDFNNTGSPSCQSPTGSFNNNTDLSLIPSPSFSEDDQPALSPVSIGSQSLSDTTADGDDNNGPVELRSKR